MGSNGPKFECRALVDAGRDVNPRLETRVTRDRARRGGALQSSGRRGGRPPGRRRRWSRGRWRIPRWWRWDALRWWIRSRWIRWALRLRRPLRNVRALWLGEWARTWFGFLCSFRVLPELLVGWRRAVTLTRIQRDRCGLRSLHRTAAHYFEQARRCGGWVASNLLCSEQLVAASSNQQTSSLPEPINSTT
jgi:hypothetical protein